MRFYIVYHIKGNRSPNDTIIEIPNADIDHYCATHPGYQVYKGRAQWKWTGRNIGVLKERIADSHPSLLSKHLAKTLVMADIVLYSVQQLV